MSMRKSKHQHHEEEQELPHDESNWLVSYADMMTLLFGFFVLMYAFSRVDKEHFAIVSKKVAKYFGGTVRDNPALENTKKDLQEILAQSTAGGRVQIANVDGKLTLHFEGEVLFDSGSAALREEMRPLMTKITQTIASQGGVSEIRIEGHTDDSPIHSLIFPTNWELSAARATRIVRQFTAAGIPESKLVAEGYGSSRPKAQNRDESGRPLLENQQKNRRVFVSVSFEDNLDSATKALESGHFQTYEASTLPAHSSGHPADPTPVIPPKEMMSDQDLAPPNTTSSEVDPLKSLQDRLQDARAQLREAEQMKRQKQKEEQRQEKIRQLEKTIEETTEKTQKILEEVQNSPNTRLPAQSSDSSTPTVYPLENIDKVLPAKAARPSEPKIRPSNRLPEKK